MTCISLIVDYVGRLIVVGARQENRFVPSCLRSKEDVRAIGVFPKASIPSLQSTRRSVPSPKRLLPLSRVSRTKRLERAIFAVVDRDQKLVCPSEGQTAPKQPYWETFRLENPAIYLSFLLRERGSNS